jgi:putative ABC transport system substrate-binding protein
MTASRRDVRQSLFVLACASLCFGGASRAADEPQHSNWFKYEPDVVRAWDVLATPGNPNHVKIVRKYPPATSKLRRVFVLYPRASSAYDVAISKILGVFEEKGVNAIFTVVNFENDPERAKDALILAHAGGNELIFSMGSESTAWLFENYRGGRLPVVSVCSKDPVLLGQASDYNTGSATNFAFTSLNVPIEVQMNYVEQLKPKLRNIGILVDRKNISAIETQAKPLEDYARRHGMRVINITVQDPQKAREELQKLVPDAVAGMRKNDPTLDHSVFWITGSTAVFREIATINAHADRVPVLSVVPEVVTAGDNSAVLSIGVSFESNAHLAALYGIAVLSGDTIVGKLKVGVVSPPDIAINFRKAREIGLRIPFSFFESASYIYDYEGRRVRSKGRAVAGDD